MSAQITNINWSFILDKIEEEKCILVLGPEAYRNDQGQSLQSLLLKKLDVENNPNILKHYPDDEFFLFDDAGGHTITCHQIKQFYESQEAPALLDKLVQIPFHVILTVTADKLLLKTLDKYQLSYQFDYYRRHKNSKQIASPTKRKPLIYNILGCISDEESMVLSYDDLFDYFSSVFAHKSMPDKLKMELKQAKNFIFLGVPFDRWYMQLLLRLLEINRHQYAFKRYASNQSLTNEIQTFCMEQFKIDFVNKRINEFADQLYEMCNERKILRKVDAEPKSFLNRIREMITNANFEEPISLLEELFQEEDKELYNEALGVNGRFRRLKRKVRMGVMTGEEENIGLARISESLLELVDEAEQKMLGG